MKTFVFSLDNKKIYYLVNSNANAVYHHKKSGPCFGGGRDIALDGNPIKENTFYTNQTGTNYNYKTDSFPLSENDGGNKGKVLEYEVFQIIFN